MTIKKSPYDLLMLGIEIRDYYNSVGNGSDMPRMHRVDTIVDNYFSSVDPDDKFGFESCVLMLGYDRAMDMYAKMKNN